MTVLILMLEPPVVVPHQYRRSMENREWALLPKTCLFLPGKGYAGMSAGDFGVLGAGGGRFGRDQVYARVRASDGGTRKYRLNSRLNCDGLSYPTS